MTKQIYFVQSGGTSRPYKTAYPNQAYAPDLILDEVDQKLNNDGFKTERTTLPQPQQSRLSNEEVAKLIYQGKGEWGATGQARKDLLASKGYDYRTVQNIVNQLVKNANSKSSAPTQQITNIAPVNSNNQQLGNQNMSFVPSLDPRFNAIVAYSIENRVNPQQAMLNLAGEERERQIHEEYIKGLEESAANATKRMEEMRSTGKKPTTALFQYGEPGWRRSDGTPVRLKPNDPHFSTNMQKFISSPEKNFDYYYYNEVEDKPTYFNQDSLKNDSIGRRDSVYFNPDSTRRDSIIDSARFVVKPMFGDSTRRDSSYLDTLKLPVQKHGGLLKFQIGGQMQDPIADVISGLIQNPQQTIQALSQSKEANAIIQEIVKRAKAGDQQAMQAVQVLQQVMQGQQQQQAQMAEKGAKLTYIKSLRGICPEGEELTYMKKGGVMCPVCKKKAQAKEKVNKKEYFKKSSKKGEDGMKAPLAKCGKKVMAKCGCKTKKK